jgi:DNA-binding LacI/PurR family transcriptional regulator
MMVGSAHTRTARLVTALPRSSRPPPDRTRQRYAVLVDSLDDEHELSVVQGSLSAARELDARVVVVPGGAVGAPDSRLSANNFAFDLVGPGSVLGALVLSSALGNEIGPSKLATWLTRFAGLPVCCMGVPIEGYASVRVDNAAGIRDVVNHLIEAHGKRNIGFIRGPQHSEEAEVRLAAYRTALEQHGITPDPRWIADGDYNRPSGAQAVRTLLDQRRVSVQALDALVCANDYMALGALDELGRRGINVPEQIALSGFDDVPSACEARPTLTTVRQPGSELGREGLKQLVLLTSGARLSGDRVLPVELKLRRSCGCSNLDVSLLERVHTASMTASFEVSVIQRRQLIIAELVRAAHGSFGAAGADWESALLGALLEEIRESKPGALSRRVQRLLQKLEPAGGDLSVMPQVLATLRRQALPCVARDGKERDSLEDAIADAQIVTTSMMTQATRSAVRADLRRTRVLARAMQEQMFDKPAAVSRVLAEHLPALGIDACVVAALAPAGERGSLGAVCLGFAAGKGHPEAEAVPLTRLVDHPLVEQGRTLFLLPIALGTEPLGVAAFSVTMQLARGELLEDLRELLAPVLKVIQRHHV